MDVILIQDGRAQEIWRGATLEEMKRKFHADLVAQMVEADEGAVQGGYLWDGTRFTNPPTDEAATIRQQLAASDRDMTRLSEDLVDALVAKGVLTLSDLPEAAAQKIATRRDLRARLKG